MAFGLWFLARSCKYLPWSENHRLRDCRRSLIIRAAVPSPKAKASEHHPLLLIYPLVQMPNVISLLPPLLITLLACTDGVLLTGFIFVRASLKTRLCFGAVIGLVGLSWIGFLCALLVGLNWLSIGVTTAIFGAGAFFLRRFAPSSIRPALKFSLLIYYGLWVIFFGWLFARVIVIEADGLHTAPANNYGDLPFHFSVVTSFADGDNFPPHSPIFHSLKFTYPFLIDFLTAFLHRAGADWAAAFFIPNIILILALVGLLELLTEQLTQSKVAARIAPILFFFSGGLGFVYCLRDFQNTNIGWWDFLLHLPQSYTKNDALNLEWGNMLTTLIVPQRSLLFGIPVFAMIVILWWEALRETALDKSPRRPFAPSPRRVFLFVAGILAGLMPLLHAHGFFSVMIVSAVMALVFFSWDWLAFFIPAGVLSLPQAWWLSGTGTRSSLFKFHFGWAAGDSSIFKFYVLNFGLVLFVLLLALIFAVRRTRRFYWPFVLCFIIPNVVLLAPWPWDNIKVLVYWYLVSCALVAGFIAKFWTRRLFPLSLALLLLPILSGSLDVLRGLSPTENLLLFGTTELKVAELIKQRIPPHALMLSAPIHNSVLALSGRQMLMGYPGHLWSHGVKFEERERDVKTIYLGGIEAEKLLKKYAIDFVVVGPVEYSELNADEGFFAARFSAVIDEDGYRVYKISAVQ